MIETIIEGRIYALKVELDRTYNVDYINIYYLVEEELLIDIGPDYASTVEIEKFLIKFNSSLKKVAGVILTHTHADHCGGLQYLPDNIPIYYDEIDIVERNNTFIKSFLPNKQVDIDKEIDNLLGYERLVSVRTSNSSTFKVDNIQFIRLAGHSSCDLCIHILDLNVILCGDLLVKKSLIDSHYTTADNLKIKYFEALKTVYDYEASYYLCSHEEPLKRDEVKSIIIKKLEKNCRELLKFSSELEQSQDVSKAIDNAFPLIERISSYFAYSESILVLKLLEEIGVFNNYQQFEFKSNYRELITDYFLKEKEYYE